jgi:ribonuclease VapC
MIVDSSAVIAIIFDEPDGERYSEALAGAVAPRIPAPNWLEVAIAVGAREDGDLGRSFDAFLVRTGLEIAAFGQQHAEAAREGWRTFGKGRHPAKLNFGDCLAYGFAKAEGLPLLFKGNDFPLTDIDPALKD